MLIFRPVAINDLDQIMKLIQLAGPGLSSLPNDTEFIKNKIQKSVDSIDRIGDKPAGERILFALENTEDGEILGISGVISRIGGFDPYHFNRLTSEIKTYPSQNLNIIHNYFQVEKTHKGPSEVCSLFLAPKYRKGPNGRILSLSRFLFMAENIQIFEENVIAEMRGVVSADGISDFWSAVGEKLTGLSFRDADDLYSRDTEFIDEILPLGKQLINTLPDSAIDIIGKVHPNTEPAKRLLEKEGFKFNKLVGVLEPGPILEVNLQDIRTIKNSKLYTVKEINDEERSESPMLVSNHSSAENFRTNFASIKIEGDKATVHKDLAHHLKLGMLSEIRVVSLRDN